MAWFRGLKLKLLFILIIGSIALEASMFVGYEMREQQARTISILVKERIPIAEVIGRATTDQNSVLKYSFLALLDSDSARRAKYIELAKNTLLDFGFQLERLKNLHVAPQSAGALKEVVANSSHVAPLFEQLFAKLLENKAESDRAAQAILMNQIAEEIRHTTDTFDFIVKSYEEQNATFEKESIDSAEKSERNMQLVAVLSTLFLWTLGLTIAFSVSKKLQGVTAKVDRSSDEVADSSRKLAGASQHLSSAAHEQASALEESSASLQEITGMVESNLKNTEDSVKLAKTVINLMTETADTIRELTESMDEIKKSNSKVESLAKLIEEIGDKTDFIDEIVFQTKLLSFNASVEAERAGEHGRGFSVVAQEVGNLAQMSGKSAVEIVAIVKAAIKSAQEVSIDNKKSVESGFALCKETGMKMFEVATSAQKILESSEQIYRSSQEQNSGIRQISISVEALNKATQSNAASSEASASSSATLFDLSSSLKRDVGELFTIVEGRNLASQVKSLSEEPKSKVLALRLETPNMTHSPTSVKKVSGDPSGSIDDGWDSI